VEDRTTRKFVRDLVERQSAELRSDARTGGDLRQRSRKHNDELDEIASSLSAQDRSIFDQLYHEELDAESIASKAAWLTQDSSAYRDRHSGRASSPSLPYSGLAVVAIIAMVCLLGLVLFW
jgi:hypothetical protein